MYTRKLLAHIREPQMTQEAREKYPNYIKPELEWNTSPQPQSLVSHKTHTLPEKPPTQEHLHNALPLVFP